MILVLVSIMRKIRFDNYQTIALPLSDKRSGATCAPIDQHMKSLARSETMPYPAQRRIVVSAAR
ncbi:hypothetical protein [Acidocella facilis]|uniref:hypothetical protein n=1 Tax=Acidocella facilis TaxID=525 RepID=UPI001F46DC06|nr:hypothetical protein [Acidocella facilis]